MSWTFGQTVGSCSLDCQIIPSDPFMLLSFPATLSQDCSIAWSCCNQCAGPSTWSYWTSDNWPQPIEPTFAEPSYPQADQHFLQQLTKSALNLLVQIINTNTKQDWLQYQHLRNSTHNWLPAGFKSVHHHSVLPFSPFIDFSFFC